MVKTFLILRIAGFVKVIHVQLSNKTTEILMFKIFW